VTNFVEVELPKHAPRTGLATNDNCNFIRA